MSPKVFSIKGECADKDGQKHIVMVVGVLEQTNKLEDTKAIVDIESKPTVFVKGEVSFKKKVFRRKLTLASAICHPSDTFDEERGIKWAKHKIKIGQEIGSLETNSPTMLTKDAIQGELEVKLNHIMSNIDKYIGK